MKIYYNHELKPLSRKLRNQSTLSEILLWKKLRARQILGYQFARQKPIKNYIVDFYCSKLQLVIEVDGSSHDSEGAYRKDLQRQKELESMGLKCLRFDDLQIKRNLDNVIFIIEDWINKNAKQPLTPFERGNGLCRRNRTSIFNVSGLIYKDR